jgi:A/G-specific adenine glycosylase
MLQQTQVNTVIPYYQRFMERFPTLDALACAPLDEVLHLWTGLGYYARGRNLHKASIELMERHGGEFPTDIALVQSLPGIGRSTAGAILSLSLGQRHPILDGNVKRVLSRYFGVEGFPGEKKIEASLWQLAEQCTPYARVANYTQAIMDLGATVCTRTRAQCDSCPLHAECFARREGLQSKLPSARPKRVRPQRYEFAVINYTARGEVLLEKRPPAGIWGGLWTLPQFETKESKTSFMHEFFGRGPFATERLPDFHHAFSHFDLSLHPEIIRNVSLQVVADSGRYCWYDVQRPLRIGLAKPAVYLIRARMPKAAE